MSDERLRRLERRWTESGDVRDEAAYLLERVRVSRLSPGRLRLAAYLGGAGARLALGSDAPPEVPDLSSWIRGVAPSEVSLGDVLGPGALSRLEEERLTSWSRGEGPWAKEVLVRAAIAAAWTARSAWEEAHPGDPSQERVLRAACAWVCCPCPEHAAATVEAAGLSALEASGLLRAAEVVGLTGLSSVVSAALGPLMIGGHTDPDLLRRMLEPVLERLREEEGMSELLDLLASGAAARLLPTGQAGQVAAAVTALAGAIQLPLGQSTPALVAISIGWSAATTSEGAVREAIRDEVATWALGYGDALEDRC